MMQFCSRPRGGRADAADLESAAYTHAGSNPVGGATLVAPMAGKPASKKHKRPTTDQLDERLVIPLDTEKAIEAILKVDPESEPVDQAKRQKARDRAGD